MLSKKKKYWLRGLVSSIILYVLIVLTFYFIQQDPRFGYIMGVLAAIYLSPIVPLGLIAGLFYEKL